VEQGKQPELTGCEVVVGEHVAQALRGLLSRESEEHSRARQKLDVGCRLCGHKK
jgi:hypothetical protein